MCPGFSSPTQKIVILVITVFGENSGIQALPDVQRATPAKKKSKNKPESKGKWDIPYSRWSA